MRQRFANAFAFDVNGMRLWQSKPVRQLPVVFAIEDYKVSNFAWLKGADLIAPIEAVSGVDG